MNTLAVLAAQAAVEDSAYVENYVTEVLAARELLCVGLERLGIAYVPSSANFVLGWFGRRAIEVRDALRGQGILVRDRSYEAPGAVRITVGTREQTRRLLAALEEIWKKHEQTDSGLRHGWRAGGRHRIVSRDHRANGRALHRPADLARRDSGLQEPRRRQQRLAAHREDRQTSRSRGALRGSEGAFSKAVPGQRRATA